MLIWALLQQASLQPILIVRPAGLTKQWQEELLEKFGLDDFHIYGTDFNVSHPRQWKSFPMVIASIDRLKGDKHQQLLTQADDWDLVIVDEAHKMSRRQSGFSYQYTERFRLGQLLRKKTDNLLMLTATPHQGREDRFAALLNCYALNLRHSSKWNA